MYAEIILANAAPQLDRIYHYSIPEGLKLMVGHQVVLPFGKRETLGYVVGFSEKPDVPVSLIKDVKAINSEYPLFQLEALTTAKWMAGYYGCFLITALRMFMPPGASKSEKRKSLPAGQAGRGRSIGMGIETLLLHNSSGSARTEFYLRSIEDTIKNNQGAILLVPEIGLISSFLQRLNERFEGLVAVLHSSLTPKQREIEWGRIAKGEAKIVIGTRSAVFAPIKNLGLIIIDEEHDQAYKQEKSPRYHVRDIAQQLNTSIILGSPTPSIESYYKAQAGEYKTPELPDKIDDNPSPQIEIIDMRYEKEFMLSRKLRDELAGTLSRGEKAILFINRRGYFTFAVCKGCGATIECPKCSVSLVYHSDDKKLRCGHCDFEMEAKVFCSKCGNGSIGFFGIGTQRIEQEIAKFYKDAKILRLDRDSVLKKGAQENIIESFSKGDSNILIGTQMVTKGLEKVALVGVVSADISLNMPDFRAAERTFAQLTQAAGRTINISGKLLVQTFTPDHYVFKYFVNNDYKGFYNEEIEHRKALKYPPFSRLINIIVSSKNDSKAADISEQMAKVFLEKAKTTKVLGPAKAPISKLRGQYRYQILLKGENIPAMKRACDNTINGINPPRDVKITLDIDPLNML
ncbi:MAG: primosomal protein N' (replication factor Y) (superfamily II helicase) [Candidatus Saganbacteria bacterium]|uniref:Replication restart protein PriA n=1 Tax=Candidatus Saganbacteria bacterium TaxID=2575572 RepID=A0A833L2A4_UNCSA|nr:MAG: primosomal protein N' (replication factor Y) (superfamily II helicase) [Candidatus Saganbacteria bacterium]